MGSTLIGLMLLFAAVAATAGLKGSPLPVNPCPVAPSYCQARSPESGLPQDYPPPAFLARMRAHCTQMLTGKLTAGPDTLFGPGFAPRFCRIISAFLGATPGEWRAVIIAQMRTDNLKETAAGHQLKHQLKRQIKAAVMAQVAQGTAPGLPSRPPAAAPAYPRPRRVSLAASMVVAGRLRAVRVAMERAAIRRTGGPVRLPTGVCDAVLTLSPAGRVRQMKRLHCSNEGLRGAFRRAVFSGGALFSLARRPQLRVRVRVAAPLAEPGIAYLRR